MLRGHLVFDVAVHLLGGRIRVDDLQLVAGRRASPGPAISCARRCRCSRRVRSSPRPRIRNCGSRASRPCRRRTGANGRRATRTRRLRRPRIRAARRPSSRRASCRPATAIQSWQTPRAPRPSAATMPNNANRLHRPLPSSVYLEPLTRRSGLPSLRNCACRPERPRRRHRPRSCPRWRGRSAT